MSAAKACGNCGEPKGPGHVCYAGLDAERADGEVVTHLSPAVPGEVHLGPADDCHTCGTEVCTDCQGGADFPACDRCGGSGHDADGKCVRCDGWRTIPHCELGHELPAKPAGGCKWSDVDGLAEITDPDAVPRATGRTVAQAHADDLRAELGKVESRVHTITEVQRIAGGQLNPEAVGLALEYVKVLALVEIHDRLVELTEAADDHVYGAQ